MGILLATATMIVFTSLPKGDLTLFTAMPPTLVPKSFDYYFLATLDERGQGIPNDGDERGGIKRYQCDQNYNVIER